MLRTFDELGYRQEQRFHFELGLLKLVHLRRLLPVEEVLSKFGGTAAEPTKTPSSGSGSASLRSSRPAGVAPMQTRPSPAFTPAPPPPPPPAPVAAAASPFAPPAKPAFSPFGSEPAASPFAPPAPPPPAAPVTKAAPAPAPVPELVATPIPESSPEPSFVPPERPIAAPVKPVTVAVPEPIPEPKPQPAAPVAVSAPVEEPTVTEPVEEPFVPAPEPITPIAAPTVAPVVEVAPEPVATPEVDAGTNSEAAELQRIAVDALMDAKGQTTAADALADADWSIVGDTVTVQTEVSKIMLPTVLNPEAEKIARAAVVSRKTGFKVVFLPGAKKAEASKKPRAAKSGSAQAKALEHPIVQEAQRLFRAEVRNVIDLTSND